jgi:shikimate dehydrogenase
MKAGLLGYPISHSLSPAIHRAAYAALGLDWEYALYPCEDQAAFLRIITEAKRDPSAFVGFNVTTPYKVSAWEACVEYAPSCAVLGNANVLTFSADTLSGELCLCGDNTDGRGLVAALEQEAGVTTNASSVVLCGMGPVALSALLSLIERGATSVSIVSRDPDRARVQLRDFCARLDEGRLDEEEGVDGGREAEEKRLDGRRKARKVDSPLSPPAMKVIGYGEVVESLADADILIDATSVGMNPTDESVVPLEALRPELTVLDVVYGHGETALIRGAREVGAKAIDGLGMLIEQAALTVEIWAREQGVRVKAPREAMRQAALDRLAGQIRRENQPR